MIHKAKTFIYYAIFVFRNYRFQLLSKLPFFFQSINFTLKTDKHDSSHQIGWYKFPINVHTTISSPRQQGFCQCCLKVGIFRAALPLSWLDATHGSCNSQTAAKPKSWQANNHIHAREILSRYSTRLAARKQVTTSMKRCDDRSFI